MIITNWRCLINITKVVAIGLIAILSIPAQSANFLSIKNSQNYLGSEIWELSFSDSPTATMTYDIEKNSILLTVSNSKTTPLNKQISYKNRNLKEIKLVKKQGNNYSYVIQLTNKTNVSYAINGNKIILYVVAANKKFIRPLRVAIDPGHGGKDPGAIGKVYNTYEKNVTLQVAKNLYSLLNQDPYFVPILTRSNDTYVAVTKRPDIARKQQADILISLHADSALNTNAAGGSIWILSNRRATTETGRLIEDAERKSSLLGGVSEVLNQTSGIEHTILDLQFSHIQKLSTQLAKDLLANLKGVINLHKNSIQYASLGVLRNPDIPSILVEMGFLSNRYEESVLRQAKYQAQIANALYAGLINYRNHNMLLYGMNAKDLVNHATLPQQAIASGKGDSPTYADSGIVHVISKGDTISRIAEKYKISAEVLLNFNQLTNPDRIYVGQKIKIPTISSLLPKVPNSDNNAQLINVGLVYKVQPGDTLSKIALAHQLTVAQIRSFNNLPSANGIRVGQILKIPSTKQEIVENYLYTDGSTETRLVDQGLIYTIKAGDNLTAIAQRYKLVAQDLIEFNNLSSSKITVGQKIKIPQIVAISVTDSKKVDAEYNKISKNTKQQYITYKVQAGDTLQSIARKFNSSVAQIKQLNNLKSDKIYLGSSLKIANQFYRKN